MTSPAAPCTDPLAVQVMRAVLGSRLPAAPEQRHAIEDALAVSAGCTTAAVQVRVSVGHSECEARCSRSAPVELWSVRVEEEEESGGAAPLPPVFLLNAVRSYVHFSQLSAWMRPQAGGPPPPVAASYELLAPQGAGALPAPLYAPADATLVEHAFPLALESQVARAPTRPRRVVRVSVRFVQRERPLSPAGLCLQLGRLQSDEWLLPSPLPSPTGNDDGPLASSPLFGAAAAAQIILGGKHKACEPPLYSPNGPAMKQMHYGGEKEEELVIECVRDEKLGQHPDTVVEEERSVEILKEKEGKGEKRVERRRKTATPVRERKLQQPPVKREKKGGLRRMIGGWEECVLKGIMDGRALPDAGYTVRIVAPSAPSIRLALRTSTVTDTVATCVGRVTVAEEERAREEGGYERKVIRRRGYAIPECGQIQMALLNGEGTSMHALTIPYDVKTMPTHATTVVRHRVRFAPANSMSGATAPLRYLVQMSISRDRSGRSFLSGELTLVFTTDMSVDGANVEMDTVTGVARAAQVYELSAETITAAHSLK
ncbi:hypothetical protein PFISCL1PPCAC_22286 [Pristionchus fissidentatus]|uniref:Uncharacterized protein n=1 Tax=Pristionchus fissidentatus TaxID=1538716 RepID=A0AAV5WJU2_9BILA|nr:hypothetical protein PFISCL1PPCAC_22286 [Pristionchus fissidentatus]